MPAKRKRGGRSRPTYIRLRPASGRFGHSRTSQRPNGWANSMPRRSGRRIPGRSPRPSPASGQKRTRNEGWLRKLMTLASLSADEREVVRRSLAATFHYFDFDFQTRLGIEPEEMNSLLAAWPAVDDSDDDSAPCLAINNSLNDLLHGIGISDAEALELVGVNRDEMWRVYRKWATARGWPSTGVR